MDVMLLWPWMLALAGVVAVVLAVLGLWLPRHRRDRGLPVAHVDRMTGLAAFRGALLRYRLWIGGALLASVVGALVAGAVAARPSGIHANQEDDYKRDIMLCLDVSGSMVDVDAEILGVYQQIAAGLDGERIGMRIFDASSVMSFPLTSDYDYIAEQLGRYERALNGTLGPDEQFNYLAGTASGLGASLVGDGLASCVLDFADLEASERPRSIILATDNMVNGQQIFSLPQAGQLAVDHEVRVYAINPFDWGGDPVSQELRETAEGTGGAYFPLDFAQTVPQIVDRVNAIEAGYIETPPQIQVVDRPGALPLVVLVVVAAVCAVAARVRL
ncbi:von Willebrand factor type A domain-containing protein [Agrococcus baldri]|uniref:von Willebrand factor type A domain-containing protein n=1 Tax=Agrococcus baldri TaxID=153730 RepID=A0AA94KYE1_9MICO|nr:VWA domain-containing protein [Agrococcus baldri]SFR97935.1 von Willebrand factor type A domain-containing protein [Agrococcus baldri]